MTSCWSNGMMLCFQGDSGEVGFEGAQGVQVSSFHPLPSHHKISILLFLLISSHLIPHYLGLTSLHLPYTSSLTSLLLISPHIHSSLSSSLLMHHILTPHLPPPHPPHIPHLPPPPHALISPSSLHARATKAPLVTQAPEVREEYR